MGRDWLWQLNMRYLKIILSFVGRVGANEKSMCRIVFLGHTVRVSGLQEAMNDQRTPACQEAIASLVWAIPVRY